MSTLPTRPPVSGAKGFIHHVDNSPAYWMQNFLWIMLADSNDTGGRWSMMEQLMPQGVGPPPHKHLWSDETFYILDGTITFLIGDEIKSAGKGSFINIPRGTRHHFRTLVAPSRTLILIVPAGLEGFFREMGTGLAAGRTALETMTALSSRYDSHPVE